MSEEMYPETIREESAPVPTEQEVLLMKKVSQLESQVGTILENNKSMHVALTLSKSRGLQLESNVEVLRKQRDQSIERETDALVDKSMLESSKKQAIAELEQQLKSSVAARQPLESQLNRANTSLAEIRDKFGVVKQELKTANNDNKTLAEQCMKERQNAETIRNALDWYAHQTSGLKYSVPFQFKKKMSTALTPEHIVTAYLASKKPSVSKSATKSNLTDFIVKAVREEAGFHEI